MSRIFFAMLVATGLNCQASQAQDWQLQPLNIQTRWAAQVGPSNALPEYPRPQLVRAHWQNLNGLWSYAITGKQVQAPEKYDGAILVPYPVESALSGVKRALLPDQLLWYRRTFARPATRAGERVLLNFGAVDWQATVYVNGREVGTHSGGYQNFSIDITRALRGAENELIVKVLDPTDFGPNPRGKQTLTPKHIMYTASSGIWQTVWLEVVPRTHIAGLKMTPDVERGLLDLQVSLGGARGKHTIEAIVRRDGDVVAWQRGSDTLVLEIDRPRLWSPDDPFLYDLEVRVLDGKTTIDSVASYFGMRSIEVRKDERGVERIFLNGRYTYNLGTLDQGFWPEGLYTAPTDAALQFDVQAAKAMGFNTIRKHIKVEPARWYYHCDRLGMLVWQDLVQPGGSQGALPAGSSDESRDQFEREVEATLAQLHNSPSIVLWTLFNEGWGTYDEARLTAWIKQLDHSRLLNAHSGANYFQPPGYGPNERWVNSDLTDVHSYPPPLMPDHLQGKARVIGEYGGIGAFVEGHLWDDSNASWGYVESDLRSLEGKYGDMIATLSPLERAGLSGSIYTQPYDVESEQNGLMTYDRSVIKVPVARLRELHETLVPAARNYAGATAGFSIETADAARGVATYTARLAEYAAGNRKPTFLRRLALMARRQGDQSRGTAIGNEYISTLGRPYSTDALEFIFATTRTSKDKGFELMRTTPESFADTHGPERVQARLQEIAEREGLQSEAGKPAQVPGE